VPPQPRGWGLRAVPRRSAPVSTYVVLALHRLSRAITASVFSIHLDNGALAAGSILALGCGRVTRSTAMLKKEWPAGKICNAAHPVIRDRAMSLYAVSKSPATFSNTTFGNALLSICSLTMSLVSAFWSRTLLASDVMDSSDIDHCSARTHSVRYS
jgi:hypothetical protein